LNEKEKEVTKRSGVLLRWWRAGGGAVTARSATKQASL